MIVLLTEEGSMKVTVEALMRRYHAGRVCGRDWFVIPFQGKNDLERKIRPTLRSWTYGEPTFVILRDADGGDCKAIKKRLADLANETGKSFKVRIVCQELESWFIGDSEAVGAAYRRCRFSNETAKYRDPDRLTNASGELTTLTGDRTKESRATQIAAHLEPERNRSHSFQVFFKTLQQLLG